MAFIKNIVTDYACPTNGTSDCRPAFATWKGEAVGQDCILTCPAHTYKFIATGGDAFLFSGMTSLVVEGTGATFQDNSGAGTTGQFHFGGKGIFEDSAHDALLASAYKNSTTLQLLTVADHALFTVDRWALLTGVDLQAFWESNYGFPMNSHLFEYVFITAKDTDTGLITLASPIRNTYLQTWPLWVRGSAGGGPAALYVLQPEWNTSLEFRGVTFERGNSQLYAVGRNIVYRGCTFNGTAGPVPTQNGHWQVIDSTAASSNIEMDKLIKDVTISGSTIGGIQFQSSSIDNLYLDDSTISTSLIGTPKNAVITNSTVTDFFSPGAYAYGRSDNLICHNCNIPTFGSFGHVVAGFVDKGGSGDSGIQNLYTMANGIIKSPNGTTITGIASSGGLVRLTVASSAGFTTGKIATVQALAYNDGGGNVQWDEINGAWELSVVNATTIDLVGSDGSLVAAHTYAPNTGTIQGGSIRWAVPGSKLFWADENRRTSTGFRVLDVYQDTNFTYIKTDLTGSFPVWAYSGNLYIRTHPAPQTTMSGCTGSLEIVDLSGAPSGRPMYSYTSRTHTGALANTETWPVWGRISSISVNVTTPYTGATGTVAAVLALSIIKESDYTDLTFAPSINLKIPGERTLNTATYPAAWGNPQSLDSLPTVTEPIWSTRFFRVEMTDISGESSGTWPTFTVTIATDQGIVPLEVAPMRARLKR